MIERAPSNSEREAIGSGVVMTILPDFPFPANTGLHLRMTANLQALFALDVDSHVLWFSTPNRQCGEVDVEQLNHVANGVRHGGLRAEQHEFSLLRRLLWKVRFLVMGAIGWPHSSYPYSLRYDAVGGADVLLSEAERLKPEAVVLPSQLMHWCDVLDPSVTVVIDAADVLTDVTRRLASTAETSWFHRLGLWANHFGCRAQERRYFGKADEVWVTTAAEAVRCRSLAPDASVVVVPNAVPAAKESASNSDHDCQTRCAFGMIATWSYRPNLDAAIYLIDRVLPMVVAGCPGARLVFAGAELPPELIERCRRDSRIEYLGRVEQVSDFYDEIAVAAIPLVVRGGVPLKLAEAMAYSRPVVASAQLVDGLNLVDGVDILVGVDPVGFANSIIRLFEDDEIYGSVAAAGLNVHRREFSLERVVSAVHTESRLSR